MVKIGFLGPEGTFSHEALESYAAGDKSEEYVMQSYNTISEMLYDLQKGRIDEAIAPMENSIEGAINITLDMLAFELNLKIKAEHILNIKENLLIKPGSKTDNISLITSHPQPIGQCRKYIDLNFPNVQVEYSCSTAEAAKKVEESDGSIAAIGSKTLSTIYAVEVADEDIQDNKVNMTRFVVISRKESKSSGRDKTSIVFSTENKPGSLYEVLGIFNIWKINMTRIESRPSKNRLGEYIFFIDIEGHREDQNVRNALEEVQKKVNFYKFLGSYPMHAV